MKKAMMLALVIINLVIFNQPAQAAAINDNANPRAFLAQDINSCRVQMKDKVVSGEMTKEELKQCIENMKNSQCINHSEGVCTK